MEIISVVYTCAAALHDTHTHADSCICPDVCMRVWVNVFKECLRSAGIVHYLRFHKPWQIILHGSTCSSASIQHVVNAHTRSHTTHSHILNIPFNKIYNHMWPVLTNVKMCVNLYARFCCCYYFLNAPFQHLNTVSHVVMCFVL